MKPGALTGTWASLLEPEFQLPYMQSLQRFLHEEKAQGKVIFPAGECIFNAFNMTPFEEVKVVILGQDPYHGPNQAHGLSFSVPNGVAVPPSLNNIIKEIIQDEGLLMSGSGDLTPWAQQGVLLLNATLTVEQAKAGAHQKRGWETFTDKAIELLNDKANGIVFMLWGKYAQQKGQLIDRSKHLVLESVHPSPLSAHRGFFGCKHFSQANEYLVGQGKQPINWSV